MSSQNVAEVANYTAYTLLGLGLLFTNATIILIVSRHRTLRAKKEYIILTGLAFADALMGFSTLSAALYRANLFLTNRTDENVRRQACLFTPHFIPLSFSMIFEGAAMFAVSIDRYLAIRAPLQYRLFGKKYAFGMLALCATFALIYVLIGSIRLPTVTSESTLVGAVCLISAWDQHTNTFMYFWRAILSAASVTLYAGTVFVYAKKMQARTATSVIVTRQRVAQRRFTVTTGISNSLTFFLTVVPSCVMLEWKLTDNRQMAARWGTVFWILNCVNAMLNLFIYAARHRDIRLGLRFIRRPKELPAPSAV
uniref:G-protein coupled receptors family 1 profile domain-containing protein n=1 Tax=Plectus sambesii TaxID=2011161 RepID=A0A914V8V5_9BILA